MHVRTIYLFWVIFILYMVRPFLYRVLILTRVHFPGEVAELSGPHQTGAPGALLQAKTNGWPWPRGGAVAGGGRAKRAPGQGEAGASAQGAGASGWFVLVGLDLFGFGLFGLVWLIEVVFFLLAWIGLVGLDWLGLLVLYLSSNSSPPLTSHFAWGRLTKMSSGEGGHLGVPGRRSHNCKAPLLVLSRVEVLVT